MLKYVVCLIVAWNLIAFLMMGIDKWKAKRGAWRIPEWVLLLSALTFGSVGALLGMYCFRHKTRHYLFRFGLPMMLILHVVLVIYLTNQGIFDKI